VLDAAAKPLAWFADGTPAAFEHQYGRGRAIIVGSYPGQANETAEATALQRSNVVVGSMPGERATAGQHPLGVFLPG